MNGPFLSTVTAFLMGKREADAYRTGHWRGMKTIYINFS